MGKLIVQRGEPAIVPINECDIGTVVFSVTCGPGLIVQRERIVTSVYWFDSKTLVPVGPNLLVQERDATLTW